MSLPEPYYQDSAVQIFHGDCLDIIPHLPPYDVLLTDPPYAPEKNTPESNFRAGIAERLRLAASRLPENATAFVFSTSSAKGFDLIRETMRPLELKRILPWVKEFTVSGVGGPWRWDSVLVGVYGRATWGGPKYRGWFKTSGGGAVSPVNDEHPVSLPDGMSRWLMGVFPPGTTFCEPFCGSGSLLLHARQGGYKVFGIDKNKRYCDLAARRLSQEVMEFGPPVVDNPMARGVQDSMFEDENPMGTAVE